MKRTILFIALLTLISSCGIDNKKYDRKVAEVDSLNKIISVCETKIKAKDDTIMKLRFPAADRLLKAKKLVEEGSLYKATLEINNLKELFPLSNEANLSDELLAIIKAKKEEINKEQERLKALGFKALTPQASFTINYNTITISGLTIGNKFTFDYRSDEWTYIEADRGNKYITATMLVKSSNHDPNLPQLAVYQINGAKMTYVTSFDIRFAKWMDYGTYLGNYHDSKNDFAKVSKVKFKIGAEVATSITSRPFAVICKKENALSSLYNRFDNPPISYVGSVNYPNTLTIENLQKDFVLVKLYNL